MSEDILEQIDGALEDYTVSKDAMRWSPDPQPEGGKIIWWDAGVGEVPTDNWRPLRSGPESERVVIRNWPQPDFEVTLEIPADADEVLEDVWRRLDEVTVYSNWGYYTRRS